MTLIAAILLGTIAVFYLYEVKQEGELELENAHWGTAFITREVETEIPHIRGENYNAMIYAQGFAHAQTRLWQMERMRRVASGQLSELFGASTVTIDKYFRSVGLHRDAEVTLSNLGKVERQMLQAYADGVNDFVQGVDMLSSNPTARILPPEFILFGITKEQFNPWTPIDSITCIKMMGFNLTWNWSNDLLREAFRQKHEELAEIVEDLVPFASDKLPETLTIVDEEDVKQWGQWSDKSITDRYNAARDHVAQAVPPIPGRNSKAAQPVNSKKPVAAKDKKADTPKVEDSKKDEPAKEETHEISPEEKAWNDKVAAREKEAKDQEEELLAINGGFRDAAHMKKFNNDMKLAQQVAEAEKEVIDREFGKAQETLDARSDNFMAGIDEMLRLLDSDDDEGEALEALLAKMTKELEDDQEQDMRERAEKAGMSPEEYAELEKEWIEQQKAEALKEPQVGEDRPIIGEQMSSNNWVIHGKHTASGFPLIANDPHLNMAMPAPWTMNELSWKDKYLIGVSVPGIPSIAIGRNKDLAWAITATLVDNSDLWEEEVNDEGTKYKVDGEWRDIRLIKEQIKVKGEKTIDFVVGFTHRGPLMDYDVLSSATQLIFAGTTPTIDRNIKYSFGWAAQLPVHDSSVKIITMLGETQTVKEAFDRFDGETTEKGWNGFPANFILADTTGDIGYMVIAPAPVRKDKTPYIGSRVLDGRTTAYDWEFDRTAPLTELPRSLNPSKGYIVTANNRHQPDNVKYDHGVGIMSTPRQQRIVEMIEDGIKAGKKFTIEDMSDMQQDVVDIQAKRLVPLMKRSITAVSPSLTDGQRSDCEAMLRLLEGWDFKMDEESVAATVYSFALLKFNKSLFHKYESDSEQRANMIDGYLQPYFVERLIKEISEVGTDNPLNRVCEQAHPNYKGPNYCAYNLARAFAETKNFLDSNMSQNTDNWIWRNAHYNSYMNLPFSRTPLKFLFHRNVPCEGNGNTVHSSKYSLKRNYNSTQIESTHGSNYKQLMQLDSNSQREINRWNIDTGMNGHPFQGNYFKFNKDHMEGKLHDMIIGLDRSQAKTKTLTLRPVEKEAGQKPKSEEL